METNKQTKKSSVVKRTSKANSAENDPFASAVELTADKKPVARKPSTSRVKVENAAKSEKKVLKKGKKSFAVDPFAEVAAVSSPVKKVTKRVVKSSVKPLSKPAAKVTLDITAEIAAAVPKVELSPVFQALADVSLPELQRENRARLQMQTPTRLYFYWSVKESPWAMLRSVFGDDTGSYTLVIKLIDVKIGTEEIKQCEAEGNWWFDVEPDHTYQAEIGFYAPNRPYFRILHSNTVETPRRSPSPRTATQSDWKVTATKFAEVLDVAGFSRDAFDVAMAGDDMGLAEDASHRAFRNFVGGGDFGLEGISPEEIRYALLAIASGITLEELKMRISPSLFAILQANTEILNAGSAMSSLSEHFEIEEAEFTEEEFGAAVYGASLVNFPKTLKTRTVLSKKPQVELSPRHNPVSSHSVGR